MAHIRPFQAIRPSEERAAVVAALPYDVMSSEEAREMVRDNPYSFLHVDKSEVDLPVGTDLYASVVYEKAKENLERMIQEGTLIEDQHPCLYIYKQVMGEQVQVGIVASASIDDYLNNVIKKHEFTREEKEQDRIRHVDTLNANTGPIFLTYRHRDSMDDMVKRWMDTHAPVYDFVSEDRIGHTVWVIDDPGVYGKLCQEFAAVDSLYIADGHHRCASGVKVGLKRREENPGYTGDEEFNYFLSVIFPDNQLLIMDYNRVVKDLNGLSEEEFFKKLQEKFHICEVASGNGKPKALHTFGMYLGGRWYELKANPAIVKDDDPVLCLDVSIMQNEILHPILGIEDPRTDRRIDFIGGIRGMKALEERVDSGKAKVAFAMYPTSIGQLMDIADAGEVMPPKSTWFEPKLRSGLFIHTLS